MAIRIYDQTLGQLAGVSVATSGKGTISSDGLEGYAQMVVSASGQPVSSTAGVGNLVSLSGATVSAGSLSFTAGAQYAVIDTQGFEGVSLTVLGTWVATVAVQWSNLPTTGFISGSVIAVDTGSSSTSITANGQYRAVSGGRYLKILVSAYTSGTIVITPTLISGASASGSNGGISATANAAAPVLVEGATNQPLSLDLASNLRVLDATVATLVTATNNLLSAGAVSIPPQVPVARGNTTLTRGTPVSISTATDTVLISATSSQYGRLHRLFLTIAGTQTLTFKDGSTTLAAFDFPSTGGALIMDFSEYWYFITSANTALNLTTSSTAAVKGFYDYVKSV